MAGKKTHFHEPPRLVLRHVETVQNAGFAAFVGSPTISDDDQTRAIEKIFNGRANPLTIETLKSMARRGRLMFLSGFVAALTSWSFALSGIVPNGLVEIPAAIIAGGLAVQIGAAAIHMDPAGGWTARVLAALADYVRALRWLVPALALASGLEVFLG